MSDTTKSKGPWIHRFAIRLFTVILTILIFWALGFLVDDIESIKGPDYKSIENKYLDLALITKKADLEKEIDSLSRQIQNQTEKQKIVGDSSLNLQTTINQLLALKKLGMEKSIEFSETEQTNFSNSLQLFLENQKKYQELSQTVSEMVEKKQELVREREANEQEIHTQCEPARAEYNKLMERHNLKLAFLQLAILLPLLIVAAVLIVKKRASIYFPLFLAFGIAVLIKVALVLHEYFPSKYFKYILIGSLLLAVARLLIHFIRIIAFPKPLWLIKQFREAYERFLCPVCEYPIRIGPRRFLFWTRRTINKIVVPTEHGMQEEKYTCPACGNILFEECTVCHKIRHSMLPNCIHCGAVKEIK